MKQAQETGTARIDGVSAAVLAGGQSRRFGSSKAYALLGGKPLVRHVLEPLEHLFHDVTIVTQNPEGYVDFDVDVVADILPGAGALGGVLTALVHAKHDHCFVVACDMPFLNPALIRTVLDTSRWRDVVVPVRDREPQPLHARYSRRCIPVIQRAIQRARFRIIDFYPEVVVEQIPEERWRVQDHDGLSFFNVNRPEDLHRAASWLERKTCDSRGRLSREERRTHGEQAVPTGVTMGAPPRVIPGPEAGRRGADVGETPETETKETMVIGVMGGSGLYEMDSLQDVTTVQVETPFGNPSDDLITGSLDGIRMVFLPRHGRGHRWSPSEVNYRANIYAMKKLGVSRLISVSAVGSMREAILPGDIVVCDQFFDRTRGRVGTFFREGLVAHVLFADPVCPDLSRWLLEAGRAMGARMHSGGTYLVIEGPQFSTRAESTIYRQWGVDVIGMTNLPEARLAREAEICYATLALATDYDCWHETEDDVSVSAVLEVLRNNVALARDIVRSAVNQVVRERTCPCAHALDSALITDPETVPERIKQDLGLLIGNRLERGS